MIDILSHFERSIEAGFDHQELIRIGNLCKPKDLHIILEIMASHNISTRGLDFKKLVSYETDTIKCVKACLRLDLEREDWMTVFTQVPNLTLKSVIEICAVKNYIISIDEAIRLDPSKPQIEKTLMSISHLSEAVVMKGVIDSLSYVPMYAITEMRPVFQTLLVKEFNNLYRRSLTEADLIQVISEELRLGEIEVATDEDSIPFQLISLISNSSRSTLQARMPSLFADKKFTDISSSLFTVICHYYDFKPFSVIQSIITLPTDVQQIKVLSMSSNIIASLNDLHLTVLLSQMSFKVRLHTLSLLIKCPVLTSLLSELPEEAHSLLHTLITPSSADELAQSLIGVIKKKVNPNLVVYVLTSSVMSSDEGRVVDFILRCVVKQLDQDLLTSFLLACMTSSLPFFEIIPRITDLDKMNLSEFNQAIINHCKLLYPLIAECGICFTLKPMIFIQPCMHSLCHSCATNIAKNDEPTCPFCRGSIHTSSRSQPVLEPTFL